MEKHAEKHVRAHAKENAKGNAMGRKILLIEDEDQIRKLLFDFLNSRGFEIIPAAEGGEGFKKFLTEQPDLVLLDAMLPGEDGFSVLAKIRARSFVPVIMITARVEVDDRIKGLNEGADDYVCKPFSFKELESRVLANLRYSQRKSKRDANAGAEDDLELNMGGLNLNTAYHSCTHRGQEVHLTAMQFAILSLLMAGGGRVYNRDQISDALSLHGIYEGFQRTIDAHIKNLRKALHAAGCDGNIIETVRGVGYKFAAQN